MDENKDVLFDAVLETVKMVRDNSKEKIELYLSVGNFTSSGEFVEGFPNQQLASRLISRLNNNCDYYQTWRKNPQYVFVEAEYEKGVRQQTSDLKRTVKTYTVRQNMCEIDIGTDRPIDLKLTAVKVTDANISKDKVVYDIVTKNKPDSVRILQEASFIEDFSPNTSFPCNIKYSVRKVSQKSVDKMSCTKYPCVYHCCIELENDIFPLEDKVEEKKQNEFFTTCLLSRARSILGTHSITNEGVVKIPEAKMFMENKFMY
jgi:hypothetical protein